MTKVYCLVYRSPGYQDMWLSFFDSYEKAEQRKNKVAEYVTSPGVIDYYHIEERTVE